MIPLALGGEGTCVGICPLRKVKGAAGVQNHLDLGFIRFSVGLWRHKKSGELICCGGGLFATDTRYTIVLRMFFVMRTYSLQGRGSRGRGALSRVSTNSHQKIKVFANIFCIPAQKGFLGRFLKIQQQESLLPSSISWWWQSPSFPSPLAISWLICLHILTHSCERWKLYCW